MDNTIIQRKCQEFLQQLGTPGFIIFSWQKDDQTFGVTYSVHEMPKIPAVKAMIWTLQDFISKNL